MERSPATRAHPGAVLTFAAAAALAAAVGGVLSLRGERLLAGTSVAATAAALALAHLLGRRRAAARIDFALAIVERVVDGVVFGALAWALMPDAPRAGAAALAALSTSYVASYLRAKAAGLGFDVGESRYAQSLLLTFVAVGLVSGGLEAGLWGAAAIGAASMTARIREVATAEEAA